MRYEVRLTEAAQSDLRHLPRDVQKRITKWIKKLAKNPRPPGIIPIRGMPPRNYRGRVGDYRVGFEVVDAEARVWVWKVRPRDRFYDEIARQH